MQYLARICAGTMDRSRDALGFVQADPVPTTAPAKAPFKPVDPEAFQPVPGIQDPTRAPPNNGAFEPVLPAGVALTPGPQLPQRNHGGSWKDGYEQAQAWVPDSERMPDWADAGKIRLADENGQERVTLVAPLVGAGLLLACILALLTARSWLSLSMGDAEKDKAQSPERRKQNGDNPKEAPPRQLASPQRATAGRLEGNALHDPEEQPSSTREPSEDGASTVGPADVATSAEEARQGVNFSDLFRFAGPTDRVMIAISLGLSMIHGATMPLAFFFSDNIYKALNLPNDDGTLPPVVGPSVNRDDAVWEITRLYLLLGLTAFLARSIAVMLNAYAVSDHMLNTVREKYFQKMLKQGPAWHDINNSSELCARLAQDSWYLAAGAGEALLNSVRAVALFTSAMAVSFFKDWQMSLVMAIALPVSGFALATSWTIVRDFTEAQGHIYISAGGIAESALQMVKTVAAFNGQRRTLHRYEEKLHEAEAHGIQIGVVAGFCSGTTMGVISFAMSIGLYAGTIWVLEAWEHRCWEVDPPFGNCRTGGSILASMLTILWGVTMGLGSLALGIEQVAQARGAAYRLYEIIDSPGALSDSGDQVLDHVEGVIAYDNVRFSYPGRQATTALYGITLRIPAGTTAAFVGPSGSGKSTLVSLLLRFYEPQAGIISLDGHDIRSLKLPWLRSKMALVEQEPVLFACSVSENIAYGFEGPTPSQKDIENAAKSANAHQFVAKFPKGYQTEVGERGAQLSGGQKQRIAIARALIRDPAVLLLDEATSALDTESEKVVQDALDRLLQQKKRTTLIIAHRLSTVQAADQICVLQDGRLCERGTHAELMAVKDSLYARLAKMQSDASDAIQGIVDTPVPRVPETEPAPPPPAAAAAGGGPGASLLERAGAPDNAAKAKAKQFSLSDEGSPDEPRRVPLWRLWSMSHPEYPLYFFGLIATFVVSCMMPAFCVRFTQTINLLNYPPVRLSATDGQWVPYFDEKDLSTDVSALCFWMQLIGVIGIAASTTQSWAFQKAGEKFTTRLRLWYLQGMLKQEIAWFDLQNSGMLASRLAGDIPTVRQLVGFGLSAVFQSILTMILSLGGALLISWRFTLCILACIPLLSIGALAVQYGTQRTNDHLSTAQVSETIGSIRTVAAFGLESRRLATFLQMLRGPRDRELFNRSMSAAGTGLSSGGMFLLNGATVWFGGLFISKGLLVPERACGALFMLMGCSGAFAQLAQWYEKSIKAREAADTAFQVIDRPSAIDPLDCTGSRPAKVDGRLEFRDVHFWYPSRPDVPVFQGFNLTVEANTAVALVGHSGSGKSTVVSLLERFYDPQRGSILLDGRDLRDLNVVWLRAHIGLVQQEPVLFGGSVLDNIRYGCEEATEERVIAAAKMANAHTFIAALPEQYRTDLGHARRTQLSGGQKQRIAIARALIRDPSILLLDEATSALDTASERVVQEALDSLLQAKRRTTLIVAHRLSTIRNADQICVVYQGQILEKGRHEELMANPNGHYVKLVGRQLLDSGGADAGGGGPVFQGTM